MQRAVASLLVVCAVSVVSCKTGDKAPPPMTSDLPIRIVDFPGGTQLVRAYVGSYEESGDNFTEFVTFLGENGIIPQGDLMGVYYDDPAAVPPDLCHYEIRIPVLSGTQVEEPYEIREVPAMKTAAVVLIGDYPKIAKRYPEIYAWVEENGWQAAGPMMEIYVVHPGSGVPPEQYETELHVPVVPAE